MTDYLLDKYRFLSIKKNCIDLVLFNVRDVSTEPIISSHLSLCAAPGKGQNVAMVHMEQNTIQTRTAVI